MSGADLDASRPDDLEDAGLAHGLHDEDPTTTRASEARRWVALYTELVAFEGEMLRRIRENMASLSPAARQEAERSNLPQLIKDWQRFRSRLSLWERRLQDIIRSNGEASS
jgi:hypothetical protein